MSLVDVPAAIYFVHKGDILETVRADRPAHQQVIGEDSIAVEVNLPSSLAPMARKLSGREIGCRLSFGGETRTNWKTHTSRGQYCGTGSPNIPRANRRDFTRHARRRSGNTYGCLAFGKAHARSGGATCRAGIFR